jgi:Zn-dependent protease
VSLRHGDPTARDAGRLSLNPLRHVDPFGTVLLLIAPLWGVPALFRIDPLFNLLVPR